MYLKIIACDCCGEFLIPAISKGPPSSEYYGSLQEATDGAISKKWSRRKVIRDKKSVMEWLCPTCTMTDKLSRETIADPSVNTDK